MKDDYYINNPSVRLFIGASLKQVFDPNLQSFVWRGYVGAHSDWHGGRKVIETSHYHWVLLSKRRLSCNLSNSCQRVLLSKRKVIILELGLIDRHILLQQKLFSQQQRQQLLIFWLTRETGSHFNATPDGLIFFFFTLENDDIALKARVEIEYRQEEKSASQSICPHQGCAVQNPIKLTQDQREI